MQIDKNSVPFMKDYLKHALEFEKYIYIWSNSMDMADVQMQTIYTKRRKVEDEYDSVRNSLDSLDARYAVLQSLDEIQATEYKKKKKKNLLKFVVAITVILLIFAFFLFAYFFEDFRNFVGMNFAAVIFCIVFFGGVSLIFGGAYLIGLWSDLSDSKEKFKEFTEKADIKNVNDSRQNEKAMLERKQSQAENDLEVVVTEESTLSEKQTEMTNFLHEAKKNLSDIYAEDVLPTKYRNFASVATLYEYLETGRCNTIQGHGGIYDTYETDLQRGMIIERLTEIRDSLDRIETTQRMLYTELNQANSTLLCIRDNLVGIEKNTEQISVNTAISALAEQQTAESARWMAWRAWANGKRK